MIERQREEDGVEDVKSKRRHRPPPVYFRGCRPISQLFMKWRDGFFFFYGGCWTPKAEGLPTFLISSGSESIFADSSEPHLLVQCAPPSLSAPPV